MPLSEHEQRMLDQIESALYAEDPKFASTVRGGRMRAASTRRRFQAAALFVIGLVLLVAGVALPIKPGGFPIISLIGFVFMFGSGVLLLLRSSKKVPPSAGSEGTATGGTGTTASRGAGGGSTSNSGKRNKGKGFTSRMEDRFRRRFDQE